jgi:hypothetical protein
MTRAQLILLAIAVSGAVAGTVLLIQASTGQQVQAPPGTFEVIDRSSCTQNACGAPLCVTANNIMADAGLSCTAQLITCDMRVGQQARDWAAANSLTLGPQRYQRLRIVGARCAVDGGFAWGIPLDDNGLPQFVSVAQVTPLCVRAPLDGGTDCLRAGFSGIDGTTPTAPAFFGTGNVFPASLSSGTQCEPVACSVMFGDNPDVSL